jgi:hypothetical protein
VLTHRLCAVAAAAVLAAPFSVPEAHAISDPVVTGPIPATAPAGDTSRNYPFLATILFPADGGYVEEEFFMEGTANRYTTPSLATGAVISSGHPYKVRLIVRRPSDSSKYNGKVIVEWQNVTNNWELDVQWYRAYEYFIREGYAYVGVGPQRNGVHGTPNGLRAWNPGRYGTLDVTVGGTITDDSLRWDIFSQAAKAIVSPTGVDPLGGLTGTRVLIATGDSQSSSNLATYLNSVHPLDPIYPAFVLGGPLGNRIREDVDVKVFKVISEHDAINSEARVRRPDTVKFVAWEVAGSSHSDYHNFVVNSPVRFRDVGVTGILPDTTNCIDPARSRVNLYLVYHAAYDWTVRWLQGQQPPSMPEPITVTDFNTNPVTVARDSFGIVRGGIRLADVDVPIALNNGWNSGGKPPTSAFSCRQTGTHIPFDQATLDALYRNHGNYVSKVAHVTNDNVRDGFLLEEDGEFLKDQAANSSVGH